MPGPESRRAFESRYFRHIQYARGFAIMRLPIPVDSLAIFKYYRYSYVAFSKILDFQLSAQYADMVDECIG